MTSKQQDTQVLINSTTSDIQSLLSSLPSISTSPFLINCCINKLIKNISNKIQTDELQRIKSAIHSIKNTRFSLSSDSDMFLSHNNHFSQLVEKQRVLLKKVKRCASPEGIRSLKQSLPDSFDNFSHTKSESNPRKQFINDSLVALQYKQKAAILLEKIQSNTCQQLKSLETFHDFSLTPPLESILLQKVSEIKSRLLSEKQDLITLVDFDKKCLDLVNNFSKYREDKEKLVQSKLKIISKNHSLIQEIFDAKFQTVVHNLKEISSNQSFSLLNSANCFSNISALSNIDMFFTLTKKNSNSIYKHQNIYLLIRNHQLNSMFLPLFNSNIMTKYSVLKNSLGCKLLNNSKLKERIDNENSLENISIEEIKGLHDDWWFEPAQSVVPVQRKIGGKIYKLKDFVF
ncbi:hypothetical protein RCL1_003303 [Eukaryota sp. TZLM3-RCL]